MTKPTFEQTLDAIVQVVHGFPEGASIGDIEEALAAKIPHRTLQRRLMLLLTRGEISALGSGRARRYLSGNNTLHATASTAQTDQLSFAEAYIPLKTDAEIIRSAIRKPLHERKPAGYDATFLNCYRPNESFYLDESTRI